MVALRPELQYKNNTGFNVGDNNGQQWTTMDTKGYKWQTMDNNRNKRHETQCIVQVSRYFLLLCACSCSTLVLLFFYFAL